MRQVDAPRQLRYLAWVSKTGDRIQDYPAEHGLEISFVEARDGTRLRVLRTGPANGARLLCVHGFPQNAAEWRKLLPLVRDRYRVLLIDQRGYAGSELARSGKYDLATLADDLAVVLEATAGDGATGPAIVCAHDWGGPVSWELCLRRPELVRHHVSVNGPHLGAYVKEMRASREQLKASWYTVFFQVPGVEHLMIASGLGALARALKGSSKKGTFSNEDLELYLAPLRDPARLRAALSYYRSGKWSLFRLRHDAPFEQVTVPTTIVWGERDEAITRSVAERMQREVCPNAALRWLPDASHWVPEERPDALAEVIVAAS